MRWLCIWNRALFFPPFTHTAPTLRNVTVLLPLYVAPPPYRKMGSISSDLVHFWKQLQLYHFKMERHFSMPFAGLLTLQSSRISTIPSTSEWWGDCVQLTVELSDILFWLVTSVLTSWTAITIRFQQARSSWVCWIPLPICHSCVSLVSSLPGRWKKMKIKKTNHTTCGQNKKDGEPRRAFQSTLTQKNS